MANGYIFASILYTMRQKYQAYTIYVYSYAVHDILCLLVVQQLRPNHMHGT